MMTRNVFCEPWQAVGQPLFAPCAPPSARPRSIGIYAPGLGASTSAALPARGTHSVASGPIATRHSARHVRRRARLAGPPGRGTGGDDFGHGAGVLAHASAGRRSGARTGSGAGGSARARAPCRVGLALPFVP